MDKYGYPKYIIEVYKKVATLKKIPLEELESIIEKNMASIIN